MEILKHLRIQQKLLASNLFMAVLVCITGALGIYYVGSVGRVGVRVGENLAPLVNGTMEVQLAATQSHLLFEEILSGDATEDFGEVIGLLEKSLAICDAMLEGGTYGETSYVAAEDSLVREKLTQVRTALEAFIQVTQVRYGERDQGAVGAGSDSDARYDASYDQFMGTLIETERLVSDDMVAGVASVRADTSRATLFMWIAMGLAVALALVGGSLLSRPISAPIVDLSDAARRIAAGDLTAGSALAASGDDRRDELGVLQNAFSGMTGGLRELVGGLQEGVARLASSSSEIATTAKEAAASATQQATTLTELNATTEEISRTSQTAAETAQEVVEASERSAEAGQRGLGAVDESVERMAAIELRVKDIAERILRLNEQTVQIAEIVDSVNDLSEQSNLLAVNASIEAAKAGEQGKGFAVVASEVRSLAEQSKRATQQIRKILSDVQQATQTAVMATEEGTKRAAEGRSAMDSTRRVITELADTLEAVAERVRQIAGSARQQAAGVEQVATAIAELKRSGQDTADGARSLENAVVDINALSRELSGVASRYRL